MSTVKTKNIANNSSRETEKSCREVALEILCRVEEEKAYAKILLDYALRRGNFNDRNRSLLTELVYGTLKWRQQLDWIIKQSSSRKLSRLSLDIRNILRLGAYQIIHLDRVPVWAAVNESAELARKYSSPGRVKLVNALLRNLVRKKDEITYPELGKEPVEHIAIKYSHPQWVVSRWIEMLGVEETLKLCESDNQVPPLSIRVNTLKISQEELESWLRREEIEVERSAVVPDGLRIQDYPSLTSLEAFKKGWFQVQDESSILVGHLVAPRTGDTVIDACSAPGGKTTHLAALMGNQGKIIALDIYPHKLKLVDSTCQRLGITIVETKLSNAQQSNPEFKETADRVLVDVPCSGLGVFRRRADARWNIDSQKVPLLSALQLEILENVSSWVKPQGILIYSTCTIEPRENQEVVTKFLNKHPEFLLENVEPYLPEVLPHLGDSQTFADKENVLIPKDIFRDQVIRFRNLIRNAIQDDMLQTYPHRHGIDGFFIARLRRSRLF